MSQGNQESRDNFIELKQKDIASLRNHILQCNQGICPILKDRIKEGEEVLDHNHKNKNEKYSKRRGTIRTVLDRRANILAGRIERDFIRYGLHKEYSLPDILRNIADYLEAEPFNKDGYYYIHPKEVNKISISKSMYNRAKKEYFLKHPGARTFPVFKKYPGKKLLNIFNELGIPVSHDSSSGLKNLKKNV